MSLLNIRGIACGLLLLLTLSPLRAQRPQLVDEEAAANFTRLIVSPYFSPYAPLVQQLREDSGRIPFTVNSTGYDFGLRLENYSPLKKIGIGFDLGAAHRKFNYLNGESNDFRYSVTEDQVLLTPYLWVRWGDFEKPKKNILRIGVSIRQTLNHTIRLTEPLDAQTDVRRILVNPEFRRSSSIYGYLGLGITRTKMPFMKFRNRVSDLSIGAYWSLFNQANPYSRDPALFTPEQSDLLRLSRREIYLGIMSARFIDARKSRLEIEMETKADLESKWKGSSALLPPLNNYDAPHHRIEGAFRVGMEIQPAIDSINVENDTIFGNLQASSNWTAGYTLHFLGTHRSRYLKSNVTKELMELENVRASPITFNMFLGVNATRRFQRIELLESYVNVESWEFSGEGGVRVGSPLAFIHLGAGYYLRPEALINVYGPRLDADNFNLSQPVSSLYYFAGLQLFDSLMFRVRYVNNFSSTKDVRLGGDKLSFIVGFGF